MLSDRGGSRGNRAAEKRHAEPQVPAHARAGDGRTPSSSSGEEQSILTDVAYHDYVALLCYLNATWSARTRPPQEPWAERYLRMGKNFTTVCRRYRMRVEENQEAANKANKANKANRSAPQAKPMASFLFNPASYMAFGHADEVAFVLLDDFDPVVRITGDIEASIDQACLAYCPTLESLRLPTGEGSPFRELHQLMGAAPLPEGTGDPPVWSPADHAFLRTHPLLAATKYKMSGLALLGQGLLMQQALFRAMGAKILTTLDTLKENLASPSVSRLMSREDIESVQIVLLDVQGPQELATLMLGNNYSVAVSLVAALRSLTFEDVIRADPRVEEVLDLSRLHHSFLNLRDTLAGGAPSRNIRHMRHNHAFCWTYTTLGASHQAFLDQRHSGCHGFAEAVAQLDAEPGHHVEVDTQVLQAMRALDPERGRAKHVKKLGDIHYFHRFAVGRHERTVDYTVKPRHRPLIALRTGSLLYVTRSLVNTFGARRRGRSHGRDLLDVSTSLVVPVPRLEDPKGRDLLLGKVGPGHTMLSEALDKTRRRLFSRDSAEPEGPAIARRHAPNRGRLDARELEDSLRELGVPWSLRRTIAYLYEDFADCLGNPLLFDSVLDLYDVFATLHSMITEHLPRERNRLAEEHEKRTFFDTDKVGELSALVEAIQNALVHRVTALPHVEIRDMAVDFRGGLNQIVAAADVPVKCGLGLLAWLMGQCGRLPPAPGRQGQQREERRRDTVGAVTRITFDPRPKCWRLRLGPLQRTCLARVEIDVTHLLFPAGFADFLHEMAHVIFQYAREPWSPAVPCKASTLAQAVRGLSQAHVQGRAMGDRIEEVFATLLSHLLIFQDDVGLFLRHYVASYSASPISVGTNDVQTVQRLAEMLIRAYLVTAPIGACRDNLGDPMNWPVEFPSCDGDLAKHTRRFLKLAEEVGPFFSEFRRLWYGPSGEAVRRFCREQFAEIFPLAQRAMPPIWQLAIRLYQEYVRQEFPYYPEAGYDERATLGQQVREGVKSGRPLSRNLYRNPRYEDWPKPVARGIKRTTDNPDKAGLDSLFLVCAVLRELIEKYREFDVTRGIHLHRDVKTGEVQFNARGERGVAGWNRFQLDRGFAGLFSADPEMRRRRVREQIVVLKTLWDISSNLRARRMREIIDDNWPGIDQRIPPS